MQLGKVVKTIRVSSKIKVFDVPEQKQFCEWLWVLFWGHFGTKLAPKVYLGGYVANNGGLGRRKYEYLSGPKHDLEV